MILDFYLFFYGVLLILILPVLGIGILISPNRRSKIPTPQRILKLLSSSRKAKKALENFETYYLDSNVCNQPLWFEMIACFASSAYFSLEQIQDLSNRLTQKNPDLKREIENIITLSIKDKK